MCLTVKVWDQWVCAWAWFIRQWGICISLLGIWAEFGQWAFGHFGFLGLWDFDAWSGFRGNWLVESSIGPMGSWIFLQWDLGIGFWFCCFGHWAFGPLAFGHWGILGCC
ncbi:hypothetical protein U1Q18_033389 [Sarracenia purpurea var. burkii]